MPGVHRPNTACDRCGSRFYKRPRAKAATKSGLHYCSMRCLYDTSGEPGGDVAFKLSRLRVRNRWTRKEVQAYVLSRYGLKVSLDWIDDNVARHGDDVARDDYDEELDERIQDARRKRTI